MGKKLSEERIKEIKKFCSTHPKPDAARKYNLQLSTITRHTKGIHWKNKINS